MITKIQAILAFPFIFFGIMFLGIGLMIRYGNEFAVEIIKALRDTTKDVKDKHGIS